MSKNKRYSLYRADSWSAFSLTGPNEAEVICLWNKARRRDMASHGKEAQRGATDKASGIDGTVRVTAL